MKFNHEKIHGEDFNAKEELDWYLDEENAYKTLKSKFNKKKPCDDHYEYHDLNKYLGFSYLKEPNFENLLIFGSSSGVECLPIIKKLKNIYLVDSDASILPNHALEKLNVVKLKNSPSSLIKLDDNHIDLTICFGVLHHICKPSKSLKEIHRAMKSNSFLLVREPITSMNFLDKSRVGCTPRERGLPYLTFESIVSEIGFKIEKRYFCFSPFFTLPILRSFFRSIKILPFVDFLYSNYLFSKPIYHRKNFIEKLRPASAFWILRKI
jgi:SAM-dependent methyltransferase